MSMASEELSDRIRALLPPHLTVREQKMFGGRAFMLNGNMLVGPMKDGALLVRISKDDTEAALAEPGAAIMQMGHRVMSGFIQVSGDAIEDDDALQAWIDRAREYVETLPAK